MPNPGRMIRFGWSGEAVHGSVEVGGSDSAEGGPGLEDNEMRWLLCVLPCLLSACLIEEIGTGSGSITVSNRDSVDYPVVISDNSKCLIGLNSRLEDGAQRSFSVGEQSYFCLEKGGLGVQVTNGGTYEVKDGVFRPL